MKRFLLVCLSALVSFALWADSFSAETEEGQAVYYSTISDTEVEVTGMADLTYTGHLTIPETVYNGDTPYTVTKLGYRSSNTGCFEESAFSTISLPETITYIEEYSFYKASLTSLVFPSKITSIEKQVCYSCSNLSSVTIPDGVTYIGINAFTNTGIVYLTIPNSVTEIDQQPFSNCTSLLHVDLSTSLTEISHSAFSGCVMLQDLEIPSSVKTIDFQAFNGCSALSEVIINEGVETINHSAFKDCTSLKEIVLPSTLTTLEYSVFNGCTALESVVLSENLTSIGHETFSGCSSLKEISLPEGINEIDYCAFKNCTDLSAVYSLNTTPPTCNLSSNNETVFDGVDEDCILYVPVGCAADYQEADTWKDFYDIIEMVSQSLETLEATDVTDSSATLSGSASASYNEPIIERGFEYWADEDDVQTITSDATEDGEFTVTVDGLTYGTTYTYRVYATTDSGTNYGEELTFTTETYAPVVATLAATEVTSSSAILGGTITQGSETITSKGFVYWSTDSDQTTTITVDDEGAEITYQVEGLTPETTYTYRAFAITENGTTYGENIEFTTLEDTSTGINGIHISLDDENVEGIYSTSGQKLNTTVKGVNIVRMSDGSTKKVLKK